MEPRRNQGGTQGGTGTEPGREEAGGTASAAGPLQEVSDPVRAVGGTELWRRGCEKRARVAAQTEAGGGGRPVYVQGWSRECQHGEGTGALVSRPDSLCTVCWDIFFSFVHKVG